MPKERAFKPKVKSHFFFLVRNSQKINDSLKLPSSEKTELLIRNSLFICSLQQVVG